MKSHTNHTQTHRHIHISTAAKCNRFYDDKKYIFVYHDGLIKIL